MREVEFLPDWYPKVRQRKRRVALQTWITLITVCGLGLWMVTAQRNVHAREIELSSLLSDLDRSETELQRLEDLLELQRRLGQQDAIFLRIGRPVESTRLLTTLEELMPRDMALLDLNVETEEAPRPTGSLAQRAQQQQRVSPEARLRIRLRGVAPTDVDLAEFLRLVTGKPFFRNIELVYSHERQQGGRVMREFEVTFLMELAATAGAAGGGR